MHLKKQKKVDRKRLVCRVIHLADLPRGKGTAGYFTRKQLIELVARLTIKESTEHAN